MVCDTSRDLCCRRKGKEEFPDAPATGLLQRAGISLKAIT